MIDILNLDIKEFPGLLFECECGRTHSVNIKNIVVESNAENSLLNLLNQYNPVKLFLMDDINTDKILGHKISEKIKQSGYNLNVFTFTRKEALVPDEKAVGRLFIEIDKDIDLIISVGSGTLNDLARYLSYKLNISYIIIATAPSMDGYASVVSPLIIDGFKKTFDACFPAAIIADTEIIKNSPQNMIRAGFGDMLGKYTALADWKLSRNINGEYFCSASASLVEKALSNCVEVSGKIPSRDEKAILSIFNGLILSGISMGLVGNSRPASGAEHHLAHFWEMEALKNKEDHPLHGNMVGVGTVISAILYEMAAKDLNLNLEMPSSETLQDILKSAGCVNHPAELGISMEVFYQSIIHAMEIRPRYTIFHFINDRDLLYKYADKIVEMFY